MKEKVSVKNSKWLYFFLIVINTFFGLQILKVFLSLLVNFFRERPNISLIDVATYALITFVLVFLTGFLYRLRYGLVLWVLVTGVSAARFILQVNPWPPLSLAVSALGTVLWIASFVFFISLAQQEKIDLQLSLFSGIIFGMSLTTAACGLFGTWDMVWRQDPYITFIVLLILIIQMWLTFILFNDLRNVRTTDGGGSAFYTLIAIMPFIFLQLLKFQNVASLNAVTGSKLVVSLAIILASNIAAFGFTYLFFIKKARIFLTFLSIALLLVSFWPDTGGYLYILQVIFGNIGAFWLIMVILYKAVSVSMVKIPWKNTSAMGTSGIIFFIFTFIYYSSYDINLPFENWTIPVILTAVIGICAVVTSALNSSGKSYREVKKADGRCFCEKLIPLYLMIIMLVIPLIMLIPPKNIDRVSREDGSIRVMDYNIHQGFNIKGYLDLESIARVIERSGADVVSLEEVSRGWVINGSADTLAWLSDRLGMDCVFTAASDAVWGNAILSRYPLKIIKSGFLPRLGAPLRRSFLLAEIELDGSENINIMCVHLHQIEDEGYIREEQVEELLEEWNGLERTAIMGDFNAETGDPEIKKMQEAGLIDSQLALGKEEKLTWVHYEPYRRIDYIWVTPDLEISNVDVPYSTASDHLPVVVNIK